MKKIIFSLLILFIPLHSYSQTSKEDGKFKIINHYGFKLGLVSAYQTSVTLINHNDYSSDNRLGMDIGGFIEFLNYKNFNLLTEAHFVQKGFRYNPDEYREISESDKKYHTTINYLSFTLFGKAVVPISSYNIYLLGGPRADKLISYNEGNLTGIYKYINDTNWGISIGVGVSKYLNKKISLISEFRYSKDFTGFTVKDYYINSGQYTFGNEVSAEFKNNSFEILVGIGF